MVFLLIIVVAIVMFALGWFSKYMTYPIDYRINAMIWCNAGRITSNYVIILAAIVQS